MWRIMGLVFYNDKEHFVADIDGKKIMKFDRDKCAGFAKEKGIAMYDTACEIRRLKDNASDKFLEIVTPTDIRALLKGVPECRRYSDVGNLRSENGRNLTSETEAYVSGECRHHHVPIPSLWRRRPRITEYYLKKKIYYEKNT